MQNRVIKISVVNDLVAEPVSLTEVKSYLDIDFTNHDTLLGTMISAARRRLEKYTGRSFGAKTMNVIMDVYCDQTLPGGPILAVTSATREGETDANYKLLGDEFKPDFGGLWDVNYTTNGTTNEDLKLAIMAEVAYRYENRGDENQGTMSTAAKDLARPYKIYSWV
jgi:hypothetical protein